MEITGIVIVILGLVVGTYGAYLSYTKQITHETIGLWRVFQRSPRGHDTGR